MSLLKGKKALIFGIANEKSIAYGIAEKFVEHGAEVGVSYASEVLAKRVCPIAEKLNATLCEECDLSDDAAIDRLFEKVAEKFAPFDILVHAVAFAPKEALTGRYIDTTREAFAVTMDVSVYTLVALAGKAEKYMNEGGSVITLTYFGGEKVVQNYNVMGVAKSALDSSVRYLAVDMGKEKQIRVNAISPGPIKTLAASGIGGFRTIFSVIEEIAPLHRPVSIEDCGGAAVFLASDLAKNITGEVLHVDAGFNVIGLMSAKSD